MAAESKYIEPGWITRHVFNRAVDGLGQLGDETYIVAPRGTTQWVRNLRAHPEGELKLGRRRRRFRGHEVADAEKLPILKAYLDKWAWEVGTFFELPKNPTDDEIAEIRRLHPIFRVEYLD